MNIYIFDDIRYLNNIINIESEIINSSLIVIVTPFFSNYLVDYSFIKSLNISKNSPKDIIFTSLIDINKIPKNNLKGYLKNGNLLIIIYDLFDITVQDYNAFINDTLSYLKRVIINQEQILLFENGTVGKTLDNYFLNFGWVNSDLNSFIYSTVTFLKTKGYKIKDIHNYFSNSKESRKLLK